MRNRFNVIQINGVKGIIFIIGAIICLIAGFVVFPGFVMKSAWNFTSGMTNLIPQIGILQGMLLWGIIVVAYLTFKKRGFFVEFKSAQELTGAELNEVMKKIRADRRSDIVANSILRAKNLEVKAKSELDKFEKINSVSAENNQNLENNDTSNADDFLS